MNDKFIVQIKNLNKRYKNHIVLKNLNLNIVANQITTIYGESGSGKSTLLNIIGLLEKYDSGSIILFKEKIPKVGSKKARKFLRYHLNYLFQNFALINDLTVEKNLDLVRLVSKETKANFEKRKMSTFKQLNINIDQKLKVSTLSGGQKQRIALARAMLKPGELLLCDEPTGSLDPNNKEIIFKALNEFKNQGKAILITSHDPYIIENSDFSYDIKNLNNQQV